MRSNMASDSSSDVGSWAIQSHYAVARANRREAQRRRARSISGWERVRMLLVPKHLGVLGAVDHSVHGGMGDPDSSGCQRGGDLDTVA